VDLYFVRRRGAWKSMVDLKTAGAKSAKIGNEEMPDRVRWIRSYVIKELDGRFGTVPIYEARDSQSLREHANRVGMPADEIRPIISTIVIREQPAKEDEAA
jgi:thiamine biosynthesis protein ThiC